GVVLVVVGFGGLRGLELQRPWPLPPRFDLAPRTARTLAGVEAHWPLSPGPGDVAATDIGTALRNMTASTHAVRALRLSDIIISVRRMRSPTRRRRLCAAEPPGPTRHGGDAGAERRERRVVRRPVNVPRPRAFEDAAQPEETERLVVGQVGDGAAGPLGVASGEVVARPAAQCADVEPLAQRQALLVRVEPERRRQPEVDERVADRRRLPVEDG